MDVERMRWYHTLELPGGVVTPGEFDHRPIVGRLPWPDLTGKRCLDVGSRNGFYAFEMERRGAAEVVSLDVDDPADLNMPASAPAAEAIAAEVRAGNEGFEVAREALGSKVERVYRTVYELEPAWAGHFDFAVLGTLLMHLRDPVGALQAVRRVSDGLLVNEGVMPSLTLLRRTPTADVVMEHEPFWFLPNPPALRRWVEAAGFTVERMSRPYVIPWGAGASPPARRLRPVAQLPRRMLMRRGGLHVWVLAR
jgi:tRNA (mo5U34)-methyltransferase